MHENRCVPFGFVGFFKFIFFRLSNFFALVVMGRGSGHFDHPSCFSRVAEKLCSPPFLAQNFIPFRACGVQLSLVTRWRHLDFPRAPRNYVN